MTVPKNRASAIRDHLLADGGIEPGIVVPPVAWRVRLSEVTITYWENGTLYSTSSRSLDPAVEAAWGFIESTEARFVPSERPFMIGLDEVGKEVVGPITLVGALVPSGLVPRIVDIVGLAETKTKHPLPYWEDISVKPVGLMREGLDLRVSMIPPSISDIYNINLLLDVTYQLLDVTYQQMLNDFFRNVAPAKCRVVVDDYRYRVGDTLHRFRAIESRGAEVLAEHRADDRHIEVRVASVIAKRERERLLGAVNSKPEFQVDGLSVGSGSAANDQTRAWLEAWKTTGQPWPWFIKRSVQTICELDGTSRPKKRSLP